MIGSVPVPSVEPRMAALEQVPPESVQLPTVVAPSVKVTVPAGVLPAVVVSVTVAESTVVAVVRMLDGLALAEVEVESATIVIGVAEEYFLVEVEVSS